jgi:signal transduction histidine kinase
MLPNSWRRLLCLKTDNKAMGTLAAFVQDTEHELFTVITALQAHVDLLYGEQLSNHLPLERFTIVNRAIARIIRDTAILASITELAKLPQSKQKIMLEGLMQEIITETQLAFSNSEVSLTCKIAKGTTLIGNAAPLKTMITDMLLTVLDKCYKFETITIKGSTNKKRVSLSFVTGLEDSKSIFKPWQLGKLRLTPSNGEGISLSAVDAMARLQRGRLSMSTAPDQRHGYKLTFRT